MTNNDLINKIKRLEAVQPSESWLRQNREFLFKYIDLDENKGSVAQTGSIFSISAIKNRLTFALSIFQNRMLSGSIAMAAIFILVGSFVANEAESSLPGNSLYAVKTFMEKTRLAFAFNDEKRVALNFELTEKRLDEFSQVASSKNENSGEVKVAADNLKNQLKVAAQELNSAKTNSSAEKAVSVAKIVDTKAAAYAKKLNEVKKDLPDTKQAQISEVALNVEELSDSALAVLATNSKIGDINIEEIAAKLKEKIAAAEAKIDETQKNVLLYEAEIKNSDVENIEAAESLALSVKLITEARAVLVEAQTSFDAGNFSKTWDLLMNAGEIAKVADSVGDRVAVAPNVTPDITPEPTVAAVPEPSANPSVSPTPSVSPALTVDPAVSLSPTIESTPKVEATPTPSIAPAPIL